MPADGFRGADMPLEFAGILMAMIMLIGHNKYVYLWLDQMGGMRWFWLDGDSSSNLKQVSKISLILALVLAILSGFLSHFGILMRISVVLFTIHIGMLAALDL